jgi:Replicative DNA helicase
MLKRSLGPLRKGDFGFLFARPETGKTTFLASEISNFLTQVQSPILWFNNEEQGGKVFSRVYQAVFGVKTHELMANPDHYYSLWKDMGLSGKLLLYDNAAIHRNDVSRLVEQYKPSCVVFDQIDKLKGFSDDRNDLELGQIYIWARELAKQYCPVIGVCQAGGTAGNKMWLTMEDVVNAKTAKQAEADWILGIGVKDDSGNSRFLNISKKQTTRRSRDT